VLVFTILYLPKAVLLLSVPAFICVLDGALALYVALRAETSLGLIAIYETDNVCVPVPMLSKRTV